MRKMPSILHHLGLGEGREKMAVKRPSFSRTSGFISLSVSLSFSLLCVWVVDEGGENFPEPLILFC